VITNVAVSYPQTHIISVTAPTLEEPVFRAAMQRAARITVVCDPSTGRVLGAAPERRRSSLRWIYDLHENLLAGRTGRVVNAIAAGALLLLACTGLVNWWPGLQSWKRALKVDFRRRWKRVNYDLHSAVGFWCLGLIVIWSLSGIYFTWPDKAFALVDGLSRVTSTRAPAVRVDPNSDRERLSYTSMISKASALAPTKQWKDIIFPISRMSPFEIVLSPVSSVGREKEETVYFNPYNGGYMSTWHYGDNKTLGDWIIWLQVPLHFGTHWGLAFKCLWAALGLALPILAMTGLLMYWNRFLSKRWPVSR
jgi:uncharacterized iron-regulated membrane protein